MKCLIPLFAAVACVCAGISSYPTAKHGPVGYHGPISKPVILKDGHIGDTHEVAVARSAHFAAVAKAPQGYDDGHSDGYNSYDGGYGSEYGAATGHAHFSYGPGTKDLYKGEEGYAGLESVYHGQEYGYGHGQKSAGYDGGYDTRYGSEYGVATGHGHFSYGPGTKDLYKGEQGYAGLESVYHGQEYRYGHGQESVGYAGGYDAGHGGDSGHVVYGGYAYHGPLAAPVVLKSGYLADTHDVAAAKGAHLVALEKAHADGGYHH